ncbi:MAG: [Clostridia bacterium]|nr:[FeFe] hydrogenase H-cluster maturation GTPase HydF [Clostridia bacterium]
MSLLQTVSAERLHIGFFGVRNAGKSSLVNAVTGQSLSVVSDVKGTTTDPVQKAMELLPLGPVVIIDTPGLDDEGTLGELRIERTKQMLAKTDIAVLVVDGTRGTTPEDLALIRLFEEKKLPYVIAYNKADAITERVSEKNKISVSALTGEGVHALKEMLGTFAASIKKTSVIVSDLIGAGDLVVLVTPIDEAAPKGRLILPQQLTLRELLDAHASVLVCQPEELAATLSSLTKKPALVITDSQVFGKVSAVTPRDIPLTSFSILMARYKGDLPTLIEGAAALAKLRDGDRVLISEGCTHHRQCNDIGTVKIPGWIEGFTGKKPAFSFTSGGEFPDDLTPYTLVVHCGGCMLNEAEMKHRVERARNANVPIVNYGIAIAHMHGILKRSLEPFRDMEGML